MIKTFYTDERFDEITSSVPLPIFILGSKKLPREIDALKLVEDANKKGARGIAFGRNIFQAKDPNKMIDVFQAIIKKGASADEALELLK